jgi:hypothetical protein
MFHTQVWNNVGHSAAVGHQATKTLSILAGGSQAFEKQARTQNVQRAKKAATKSVWKMCPR